ncbi:MULTISPECIES: toxic anion resistance protein [Vibrio]|uniref:toxic anion resistance protein n=1 Tax=Vibrio TaxID=662 RepID=UPI00078C105B|nr:MULTISPECIES: toxic anion resistance protein [Vibrio]BAU70960.1 hypothetical protein [Vibrio sp. 04Ya108]BBM67782.1 toxic anion resistance protein [Vibrio alfacsensis]BCN26953.1 toxic anion resistance protein [Vibrio alfacsensis]
MSNESTAVSIEMPEQQTQELVELKPEVQVKAKEFVANLTSIKAQDLDAQMEATNQSKAFGGQVETELNKMSKMLQQPMSVLIDDAESGGDVATGLLELEKVARDIDPNNFDFQTLSGFRQFLSFLGVPTPLRTWIAKFSSAESVIKSIEQGLLDGKDQLERDNTTLREDQLAYRKQIHVLDDHIAFAAEVVKLIADKVDKEKNPDKKRFLQEEILFSLSQRHQDLLTSKAIYTQGFVTSQFIIRTNEELCRSVDRAIKHTLTALGIASSLAVALARQKKVIAAVDTAKRVTEDMITQISEQLLTQGVAVLNQSQEPYIQVEVMKRAFDNTINAIDEVSKFRVEALGQMKTEIATLQDMTSDMDKEINRIEQGEAQRSKFHVEL